MITGSVDAEGNALIPLRIRGPDSSLEINPVIDTGFCDWLTLPPEVIGRLGLSLREEGYYLLADGSKTICRLYTVEVEWFGQWRRILASEIPAFSLVGMAMLRNCLLTIKVIKAGTVHIEPIADRI